MEEAIFFFLPDGPRKPLLPVVVYVHGESFAWGSGNLWDARVLASFGSVVVVTFNYRLGVLGKSIPRLHELAPGCVTHQT